MNTYEMMKTAAENGNTYESEIDGSKVYYDMKYGFFDEWEKEMHLSADNILNLDWLESAIDDDAKYVVTPKGIAYMALIDSGMVFTERQFQKFWNDFESDMRKCDYVQEED